MPACFWSSKVSTGSSNVWTLSRISGGRKFSAWARRHPSVQTLKQKNNVAVAMQLHHKNVQTRGSKETALQCIQCMSLFSRGKTVLQGSLLFDWFLGDMVRQGRFMRRAGVCEHVGHVLGFCLILKGSNDPGPLYNILICM